MQSFRALGWETAVQSHSLVWVQLVPIVKCMDRGRAHALATAAAPSIAEMLMRTEQVVAHLKNTSLYIPAEFQGSGLRDGCTRQEDARALISPQ